MSGNNQSGLKIRTNALRKKIDLDDMYSEKKVFENIFTKKITCPQF
jgi:hypothetical protein